MVIDTSAIVALLLGEEDAARIFQAIRNQSLPSQRKISAPTLLETRIVIFGRAGESGIQDLQKLLSRFSIDAESFQSPHIEIAHDAYKKFGKGSGHKTSLNFGDCFSYALAKQRDDILLCKGDDFAHTDIKRVAY